MKTREQNKLIKFKSDKFKKTRGGYSRWLENSCEKCESALLVYQKDGPGILKRLYLDRIVSQHSDVKTNSNITCKKCKTILGVSMIYKKEKRPAYRLFAGAVAKKIINGNKIKNNIKKVLLKTNN